jgi:Ras-related C3 botulinum toxin substrate 1
MEPEISEHRPNVPKILVGTKLDLRDNEEILEKLVQEKKMDGSHFLRTRRSSDGQRNQRHQMECSALIQTGVKEVFEEAICAVWDC